MNSEGNNFSSQSLQQEAFHGLTGIIKYIEPETEADRAALLVSLLVAFGNMVGRNCFYEVEATRHYPNLFAVLVGDSSKARKGTSWQIVKKMFKEIDNEWTRFNVPSGLSSGEGLKFIVRDSIKKNDEKCAEIILDKGISDKRRLIYEAEFATALIVANRAGNTLSTTIRDAWDTGNLSTLTKNDPITATDAHISILGHITTQEVIRHLTETEAANGYANRFLWVYVKRSKLLPFGGNIDWENLLNDEFRKAAEFAKTPRHITMASDARVVWAEIYTRLSESGTGLLGSITSRAEAQTMRLALIYALLDCSEKITAEHLRAGLAVWRYCEASAKYIFGERFGDATVDTVWAAISDNGGITATELHRHFGNNKSRSDIERAISELLKHQKIRVRKEENKGGRPTTIYERNEVNEKS